MINQTIQQTTHKLINLLPEDNEYYRLDELRSWGFPPFIVQRIQVELERNLAESMIPPKTDWANTQSDAVLEAWQQFVQAIRDEARLPASYAKAVVETAVADVLDMLTEPRKNIPDVIFGSDDELGFEKLQDRVKAVVVYQHFATLLPRYMQKKELKVLSRERCEKIIQKADERLTGNYSPLNWAQMLDPLFNLLDDHVDPSIFRLFFEDKERNRLAEAFEDIDESLSRAEFIEVLSAPDVVDKPSEVVEGSSSVVEEENTEEKIAQEPRPEESDEEPESERSVSRAIAEPNEQDLTEKELELDEKQQEHAGAEDEISDNVESDGKDRSINTNFSAWDTSRETTSSANGSSESDNSISSLFSESSEQQEITETKEDTESEDQQEQEKSYNDEERETQIEPEEEGDDPIWMRFMSEDEQDSLVEEEAEDDYPISFGTESSKEEVAEDNDQAMVEEPEADPAEDQNEEVEEKKEVDKLEEQLADQHGRFVESIFGGSEQAYEEALDNIVEFDNWRDASKYIQRNIFSRNLVDLYSESAVAFTDRLQNYFLEKENNEPKE